MIKHGYDYILAKTKKNDRVDCSTLSSMGICYFFLLSSFLVGFFLLCSAAGSGDVVAYS